MSERCTVRVDELRDAIDRVLGQVEGVWGPEVELGADHYWVIESSAAFDLARPPDVAAGQLSDDVASVREQLTTGDVPIVWHDLEHIIGVLRRLAALDLPPRA